MGAWNDFTLAVETLQGLSSIDWPEGSVQSDVDTRIAGQAKQLVETLVAARIPSIVADAGGTEAFFDLAAAESKLATDLQRLVGMGYNYQAWSDPGLRPGQGRGYAEKAKDLLGTPREPGPLREAVKAFAGIAPVLLGLTTEAALEGRRRPAASFKRPETKPLTIGGQAARPFSFKIT